MDWKRRKTTQRAATARPWQHHSWCLNKAVKIKLLLSLHLRYRNGHDRNALANTSGGQKAQPASSVPDWNTTIGVFSESVLVCRWLAAI